MKFEFFKIGSINYLKDYEVGVKNFQRILKLGYISILFTIKIHQFQNPPKTFDTNFKIFQIIYETNFNFSPFKFENSLQYYKLQIKSYFVLLGRWGLFIYSVIVYTNQIVQQTLHRKSHKKKDKRIVSHEPDTRDIYDTIF